MLHHNIYVLQQPEFQLHRITINLSIFKEME